MKRRLITILSIACMLGAVVAEGQTYGITNNNAVFSVQNNDDNPSINGPYNVRGVVYGQKLVGMCTLYSSGNVYALGYDAVSHTGELYRINGLGNVATPVSDVQFTIDLGNINRIAMSAVPSSVNEIKIVGRNGTNYVINAEQGTLITNDPTKSAMNTDDFYYNPSRHGTGNDMASPSGTIRQGTDATNPDVTLSDIIPSSVNDLPVYPNPTTSETRIDLGMAAVSTVYVDIVDLNGTVERSYQYDPGNNMLQVDMSNLSRGLYSVRVYGKGIGGHNLKVVKQ